MERALRSPDTLIARPGRRGFLGALGAGAALASVGRASFATAAGNRQASKASSGAGRGDDADALAGMVQFVHPEKLYFYLPGIDEAGIADLYGTDIETYRAVRARFAAAARGAARELLADASFGARVDRLPFQPGQTIVGVGDSFTDDLQSWLEILRHLLDLRRSGDGICIVNAGVSARTSADVLHYLLPVIGQQPDWIFCLVGGGDAKRVGPSPTKTMVGIDETAGNLAAIRRIAAAQTSASWVWITPGAVDEARVAAYPPFQMGQSTWRNADLLAVGDIVRGLADPVVDIQAVFGSPPPPELLREDGLHPSLAGHAAIARAVVERLTA